ncbi:MAG: hypothetical protein CMP61_09855 [Flavobacteriales bacterium]|nr:hypothetical protein [Flavobacteriales bacterium]|tara:strand:- start:4960 stop:5664 length:705 start_codon:yes stop_codon:yes gene_type:complete
MMNELMHFGETCGDYTAFWINTEKYDSIGLLFNGIGCLFWVICYAVLVRTMVKKKFVEMPFFIACGNLAWEFIWSVFYHPDTGFLFSLSYQAAFLLDCFIFFYVVKYGGNFMHIPEIKKHWKGICIGSLLGWIPLNYFFVYNGFDTCIGANSGYILNIIIAVLYPYTMIQIGAQHYSKLVAWCKMLGTGLITVSMFIFYPTNYFTQTLGVMVLLLDCYYIYLLGKRKRALIIQE